MALNTANLAALVYANGFTLWHYKTSADAKATIDTAGYFNAAADVIRVNDLIIVTATNDTGFMVVSANAAGVVDVNDLVTAGTTDTD